MFSDFVIVLYESLSCPRFKNMDLKKSYSPFWKGIKYAEDAGKPKKVQELEDFSVELLRK